MNSCYYVLILSIWHSHSLAQENHSGLNILNWYFLKYKCDNSVSFRKFGHIFIQTLPIMLILCLMFLATYYPQNYAGIIGWSLSMKTLVLFKLVLVLKFSLYLILTKIIFTFWYTKNFIF